MSKLFILVSAFFIFPGILCGQVDIENPKTARDFYERGLLREKNRQFDEAIADYTKAGELEPAMFDAHFTKSSLFSSMRDYTAAIVALDDSLKARPNDFSALFNRGLYREYLGNDSKAIASYTEAVSDKADFSFYAGTKEEARALAYHYRGRIYQWRKKDPIKAAADYTKSLQLDPEIEMVRYRRAQAYHEMKQYDKAHADFAAAKQRDPDYPNLMNAWAWQLATCPDPKYRDGKLAVKLATQTRHLETIAAAYAESGDFDKAIEYQLDAIAQLEGRPEPETQAAMNRRELKKSRMEARLKKYESGKPHREE